jgi:hypothetical protein
VFKNFSSFNNNIFKFYTQSFQDKSFLFRILIS